MKTNRNTQTVRQIFHNPTITRFNLDAKEEI